MQKLEEINLTLYIPTANFQYFDGCRRLGRDEENLLRVSKVKWSEKCDITHAYDNYEKANQLLLSIKKYEFDPNAKYGIAKIIVHKTTKVTFDY